HIDTDAQIGRLTPIEFDSSHSGPELNVLARATPGIDDKTATIVQVWFDRGVYSGGQKLPTDMKVEALLKSDPNDPSQNAVVGYRIDDGQRFPSKVQARANMKGGRLSGQVSITDAGNLTLIGATGVGDDGKPKAGGESNSFGIDLSPAPGGV